MTNASDAVRALQALHTKNAEQIARAPTGIEPGFDPTTGITWTEDGRARYRGESIRALSIYKYSGGQNITHSTTRLDFDELVYDPHSYVTTGASWIFTAPYAGLYQVICGIYLATTAGWGTGATTEAQMKVVFDNTSGAVSPPFASGTIQLDLQYPRDGDNNIQVFLRGSTIGWLNVGDTLWCTAVQESLTTPLATSASGSPGISILRV